MKCLQYWPENEDMRFGPFLVRPEMQDVFEQYTVRRLVVEKVKWPSLFRFWTKKVNLECVSFEWSVLTSF